MGAARAAWASAGLTAAETAWLPADGPANSFDIVLLALADELFRNSSVSDRTWSALTRKYGTARAMDAVVTVTHMTEAGIVFNTWAFSPTGGACAVADRHQLPPDGS
jgi:hypothetical protein